MATSTSKLSSDSGSEVPLRRPSATNSSLNRSQSLRIAQSLRASALSAVSAISEKIEVGTVFGTALNTMCNVIGAGVLSLPLAYYRASLGLAICLTLAMGLIGIFSAYVLFVGCDRTGAFFLNECFAIALIGKPRNLAQLNGRAPEVSTEDLESLNEEEVRSEEKKNLYRTVLSLMVDGCVLVNNYLCLTVYCGVILDTIPSVVRQFFKADGIWVEKTTWVLISSTLFFGLTSSRNMDELKWSSLLGIVTILWASLAIVIEFGLKGYQGGPVSSREIVAFQLDQHFFSAFGTLALAFGYHYNIPIFYHELQDRSPRKMMKTVAIAFPVIVITYLVTGTVGYLSFAQHVNDDDAHGVIINNYSQDNTLMNTVRFGLFFHFAFVYPVLGVCVRHSFHRFILTFMGRRREALDRNMPALVPRWAIVLEAFILVASSSTIAFFYPNVGAIMTIAGDLCSGNLMVTVPGIIGMCVWAPKATGESRPMNRSPASDSGVDDLLTEEPDVPPFWTHRALMYGLCTALTVFGVGLTIISFYSTVMA